MKLIQLNENDTYNTYRYLGISAITQVKPITKEMLEKVMLMSEKRNVIIQLFNARKIATWKHIFIATINAIAAFKQKRNITSQLSLEILLYATAQRQIKDAINLLGVSEETKEVAILVLGETEKKVVSAFKQVVDFLNGKEEENLLEIFNEAKLNKLLNTFKISEEEINAVITEESKEEAVVKCIIDRISIFAVEK